MNTNSPSRWDYWYSYFTLYIIGASYVAPWISMTLSMDYLVKAYPFGKIGFTFPIVNMTVLIAIMSYILFVGTSLSLNARISLGIAGQIFGCTIIPLSISLDYYNNISYILLLLAVCMCSLFGALVQSSLYGLAGMFGDKFVQAIEAGKGTTGFFLVLIRCFTKWYFSSSIYPKIPIYIFFGATFILLIEAFVSYKCLKHNEYAKSIFAKFDLIEKEKRLESTLPQHKTNQLQQQAKEHNPLLYPSNVKNKNGFKYDSIKISLVYYKIWKPSLVVFTVYFICLGCFPGLTTSIKSTTYDLGDWFPVLLVAVFNTGDYIGKSSPAFIMLLNKNNLHWPLFLQIFFLPLLAVDSYSPFSDSITFLLIFSLGCFTGYVGCSCLMIVQSLVTDEEKEIAGILSIISLIFGLCIGSYFGLVLGLIT